MYFLVTDKCHFQFFYLFTGGYLIKLVTIPTREKNTFYFIKIVENLCIYIYVYVYMYSQILHVISLHIAIIIFMNNENVINFCCFWNNNRNSVS